MSEAHDAKSFQAGTDAEIAKVSASILTKTAAMKTLKDKINALTSDALMLSLLALDKVAALRMRSIPSV